MSSRDDPIDIELTLHLDRPEAFAICVSADGEKANSMWLPRSQIEYPQDACEGEVITVTMPEWLATEKGLI